MIWLLIKRYFWVMIILYTPFAIAMFRIFKKAGRPGWYGIIPIFNILLLYPLTDKQHLFKFTLIVFVLGILFARSGIKIGYRICDLLIGVSWFVMNYSLAQYFGWKKSASFLFALNYFMGYFVLGYSNDEYVGYVGKSHLNKNTIDNGTIRIDNSTKRDPETMVPANPSVNNTNGPVSSLDSANLNDLIIDANGNIIGVNNLGSNTVAGNTVVGNISSGYNANPNNTNIGGLSPQ